MKKISLVCCLFLLTAKVFGQQFSQYNTGTLYDSFENPAQRSFIPDSSRMMAFNFFLPNFNANMYMTGDAQSTLRSRLFSDYYNTASLEVGKNKYNHFNLNVNAYAVMFKLFTSLGGDQEVGFFINSKGESRGFLTDESFAVFNGYLNFPNNAYTNIFNDNFYYQAYNQVGITYRERINRKFAFGVKFSALSGISYRQANVNYSNIVFDKALDQATLSLRGTARTTQNLGSTIVEKYGFGFQNPGAAISIGTNYKNDDGYNFQFNVKDVGFIHWKGSSTAFANDTAVIKGITGPQREINIRNKINAITSATNVHNGFTTVTNGIAEISVNKDYWFDYDQQYKFSPTLIAQKELFYNGFTAALVTPVQHKNVTVSLTTAFNDMKLFNFGGQFLLKTPNSEFYIGSDRIFQTASMAASAIRGNNSNKLQFPRGYGAYSGADFFIGFSFKFGQLIEHPMNASYIPDGEKGFFGKLFDKWFKKDSNY